MAAVLRLLSRLADFLWRGWSQAAAILLLVALWQAGHDVYGSLVLPAPAETFATLWRLWVQGAAPPAAATTAVNALSGFALAVLIGVILGTLAGLSATLTRLLEPLTRIFLGVPAIAWVVLALIWFSGTGLAAIFTVVVTTLPIVVIGAMQGARTLDHQLAEMARSYRASAWQRFYDVGLPHMLSYVFPAVATALGLSWKLAIMAELLSGGAGIGDGLAMARVNLDTAEAMAWVVLGLILLLGIDGLVLTPLKRRMEPWRRALTSSDMGGAG